jgi:hypothetical protein
MTGMCLSVASGSGLHIIFASNMTLYMKVRHLLPSSDSGQANQDLLQVQDHQSDNSSTGNLLHQGVRSVLLLSDFPIEIPRQIMLCRCCSLFDILDLPTNHLGNAMSATQKVLGSDGGGIMYRHSPALHDLDVRAQSSCECERLKLSCCPQSPQRSYIRYRSGITSQTHLGTANGFSSQDPDLCHVCSGWNVSRSPLSS